MQTRRSCLRNTMVASPDGLPSYSRACLSWQRTEAWRCFLWATQEPWKMSSMKGKKFSKRRDLSFNIFFSYWYILLHSNLPAQTAIFHSWYLPTSSAGKKHPVVVTITHFHCTSSPCRQSTKGSMKIFLSIREKMGRYSIPRPQLLVLSWSLEIENASSIWKPCFKDAGVEVSFKTAIDTKMRILFLWMEEGDWVRFGTWRSSSHISRGPRPYKAVCSGPFDATRMWWTFHQRNTDVMDHHYW